MQTLSEIKLLLESRGLRPKRSLGQNFLADHNLIRKLADAAQVGVGDLVVEVGPGTGTLTEELLSRGCTVIACELDDALADLLRERIPPMLGPDQRGRFTLVHGDCLADRRTLNPEIVLSLCATAGSPRRASASPPFSLVANLPYGAATPLLSTLLLHHPECRTFAVTIQRELADRLLAAPGTRDFGPLSVIAQSLCSVRRIAKAPPECFWPRPEVTSALVLLRRLEHPLTTDPRALSEFCSVIFARRRKQLGAILDKSIDWAALAASPGREGISPTLRAEQLSPAQIIALADSLPKFPSRGSTPGL